MTLSPNIFITNIVRKDYNFFYFILFLSFLKPVSTFLSILYMYILLALSLLLFWNLFCPTSILYTTSPSPPKICPIQYEHMRLDANLLTLCKGREGLSIFFCWCGEICTFFLCPGSQWVGSVWVELDSTIFSRVLQQTCEEIPWHVLAN